MPRKRSSGRIAPYKYTTDRGEERWRARIDIGTDAQGKRKRKTVTSSTFRGCQEKISSVLSEIRDNGTPVEHHIKLGDYSRMWLEHKKHEIDPKSYAMYRTVTEKHLSEYAGTPIEKIVPSTVRIILENAKSYNQKGDVNGPAGISLKRQIRTCLNQIMEAAYADRLIPSNPVLAVKTPKRKDTDGVRSSFSVPELREMLRIASNNDNPGLGARMWFRLLTGMRQGEILGATWKSYNPKTGMYTVDWKLQPVPRDHGCGTPINGEYPCGKHKGGLCPEATWRIPDGYDMQPLNGSNALTRPKSQTGRIVPIVPPLQQVLKLYKQQDQTSQYGLMFHDPNGNPIDPKQDMLDFRALMTQAGINADAHTGHESRHAVVTLLASQGVDFQLIKEIVGHSSDAMVEHYRHADNTERLKAMETLDSSLNLAQIEWRQ
jgi:integrase